MFSEEVVCSQTIRKCQSKAKHNRAILPYGQTSSGGKHNPGVIQIAVVEIFQKIENEDDLLEHFGV